MLLNKPRSMGLKEWLVRVLSQREHIPKTTIDAVIDHQFDEASQALKTNNSVEISGFGKFVYNKGKAEKELIKLVKLKKIFEERLENSIDMPPKLRASVEKKLSIVINQTALLKTKL